MDRFFKEHFPYTKERILEKMAVPEKDRESFFDSLRDSTFLKKNAKGINKAETYSFCFVGIFDVMGYIGYCYPKFFSEDVDSIFQIKQILRVIEKYNHEKGRFVNLVDGDDSDPYQEDLLELYLYRDYLEYGAYTNTIDILEENGEGEIDWDKTINETTPIIQDNTPYYISTWTKASRQEEDYYNRLHRFVATECSRRLDKMGLLEALDLVPIEDSEEQLSDFGEDDYIENRLIKELSTQFVTRKRSVIKAMLAFIQKQRSREISESIFLYGVPNFNAIWERACASLIHDENRIFWDIHGEDYAENDDTKGLQEGATANSGLSIFRFNWIMYDADAPIPSKGRLIPDIIARTSLTDNNPKGDLFCILDAKNYMLYYDEENGIRKAPGIQDIVKQFAYQKVLLGYIANERCDKVMNTFLFPAEPVENAGLNVDLIGRVEMPTITSMEYPEKNSGELLVPINLVKLNSWAVFDAYLSDEKHTEFLSEIWNQIQNKD